MLSAVRCWLSPPVFEGDADKTRRAVLVNAASLAGAAFVLLLIAGNWLGGGHTPPLVLALDGGIAVLCLALRAWMQRGRVRPAGAALVALSLVGLTAGVALLGSVRAPATAAYLLVVILAGLLFDRDGLLAAGALSSLAVGGLILAENAGWLPRPDYAVGVTQWVTYTALFGIAGGLSFYALHATRQGLARAGAELAEREQAESQREAALEALRRREQDFSTLVENAADMIVRFDASLRHMYCNPAVERQLGIPVQTFLGKTPLEASGQGEQAQFIEQSLRKVLETRQEQQVEQSYPTASGVKYFQTRIVPEFDPDGCIESLLAITRDVTERRQAESQREAALEALRATTARLETLIQVSPLAIILLDRDDNVQLWNPSAEKYFGWTAEEAMGHLIPTVPAAGQAEYAAWSDQVLRGQPLTNQEAVRQRKDGSLVEVSIWSAPVYDAMGNPAGRMAIIADITERKRAESQREAARAERERLIGELQAALDNIKTLRGLIPICANCKKIRDDQGYWQDVAVYVHDHSEADFTHGICPDCAKKLYPKFYGDAE